MFYFVGMKEYENAWLLDQSQDRLSLNWLKGYPSKILGFEINTKWTESSVSCEKTTKTNDKFWSFNNTYV